MFKYTSKMELLMEWTRLAPNRENSVTYQNDLLLVEISQDVLGEGVYVNFIKFDDFETIEDLNNLLYDDIDGTETAYF